MRTTTLTLLLIAWLAAPLAAQRPAGAHDKHAQLARLAERKGLKVFTVPITGEVDDGTAAMFWRAADKAQAWKADILVVSLDTPGGGLEAAQQISVKLGELSKKMLTIAFVRQKASSAGALIALSCEFIVMRKSATIGTVKPWSIGGPLGTQVKVEAALRDEFRARAKEKGHSTGLAMAMVDPQLEVVEVLAAGRTYYLTPDQLAQMSATQGDLTRGAVVCQKGLLLNLSGEEAARYGLSSLTADDPEQIWQRWELDVDQQQRSTPRWSDKLASLLSHPVIIGLLILIGGIGVMLELTSPGFGIPGLVGIACLALLLFGKHLAGLAQYHEMALLVFGLILLAVEVFLLPGFGVAGIAGLICVGLGLVLSLQGFGMPGNPLQEAMMARNVLLVLASMGFMLGGLFVAVRYLSLAPGLNRLIHGASQSVEAGYVVSASGLAELRGQVGRTASKLRPTGKAEINGRYVDVISRGEFIESGVEVRVVEVSGPSVYVEKLA